MKAGAICGKKERKMGFIKRWVGRERKKGAEWGNVPVRNRRGGGRG